MQNTAQRATQLLAASLLVTALSSASAQVGPKLEAVASNQEYGSLALDLTLFEFEGEKSYGRKGSGNKLIAKRTSRDADAGPAQTLPVGKLVVACVYASQSGTLTLWSQIDDQRPVKIFPNEFTTAVKGAGQIAADSEVCVGNTQEFRLRVSGSDGQLDKIYAHWAPQAGGQLEPGDFPAIGRSARASKSAATYASSTVQFRVGR